MGVMGPNPGDANENRDGVGKGLGRRREREREREKVKEERQSNAVFTFKRRPPPRFQALPLSRLLATHGSLPALQISWQSLKSPTPPRR